MLYNKKQKFIIMYGDGVMGKTFQRYLKMPYRTPNDLRKEHAGSNILIIGSGTSTEGIIKYKQKLRDHFDVIIGVNYTRVDFEDVMDYHMIMEGTPSRMVKHMFHQREYRKDLTCVLNFDNIRFFSKDIPIIKVHRHYFDNQI